MDLPLYFCSFCCRIKLFLFIFFCSLLTPSSPWISRIDVTNEAQSRIPHILWAIYIYVSFNSWWANTLMWQILELSFLVYTILSKLHRRVISHFKCSLDIVVIDIAVKRRLCRNSVNTSRKLRKLASKLISLPVS